MFHKLFNLDSPLNIWLNLVSGTALVLAAGWFSYNIFSTRETELPPRIVNSVVLEPTILLAGKPFKVHINVTLNRLCPYEVIWSLVRTTDRVEVVKIVEPVSKPPAGLGTQDLAEVTRYVPSSVQPGEYLYTAEVLDFCSEGHTYTSVRRNVVLTIR